MHTCSIGYQCPKHGSHLALLRLGEFAGLGQQLHGGRPCLPLQFPVEKFAMKFIVPTELGVVSSPRPHLRGWGLGTRLNSELHACSTQHKLVYVFSSINNSNCLFSIDSSLVVLDLMFLQSSCNAARFAQRIQGPAFSITCLASAVCLWWTVPVQKTSIVCMFKPHSNCRNSL